MKPFGGFDHNAQSLRVVTLLESRYAGVRRPQPDLGDAGGPGQAQRPAAPPAGYIAEYDARAQARPRHPRLRRGAGRGAGGRHRLSQPRPRRRAARAAVQPEDLSHLPVVGEALAAARIASLDVPPPRLRHETIRRVIDAMVNDLLAETAAPHRRSSIPRDADAIRRARQPVVAFSPADGRGQPGDQGFPRARACTATGGSTA